MDKVMTMLKKGSGNLFEKFVVGGMVLMTIGGYNGYNQDLQVPGRGRGVGASGCRDVK